MSNIIMDNGEQIIINDNIPQLEGDNKYIFTNPDWNNKKITTKQAKHILRNQINNNGDFKTGLYNEIQINKLINEANKQGLKFDFIKRKFTKLNRNQRENNIKSKVVVDALQGFNKTNYTTYTTTQEELYNNIFNEFEEIGDFGYVSLMFQSTLDNKIRNITIAPDYFDSYEEFINRINQIKTGEVVGSDKFNEDEYDLITNMYSITNVKIHGEGVSKKMIFNVKNFKATGRGDCSKISLDGVGIYADKSYPYLKDLCEIVKNHNKDNNDYIAVIGNTFTLSKKFLDIKKNKEIFDIDLDKTKHKGFKPNIEDINLVFLNGEIENPTKYIIYDELSSHYDYIDNSNIQFEEDILLTYRKLIVKKSKDKYIKIFKPSEINKTNKKNRETFNYKIVFDYETIIDFKKSNCMREYSLSILILDDYDLEELDRIDKTGNKQMLKEFLYPYNRPPRVICFKGFDCSQQFLKWLMINQVEYLGNKNIFFDLISFNGANFDNFILLNALLNDNDDLNVSNIMYSGNQLLDFTINGKHRTFDIRKHLVGSLKSNCAGFKLNLCSKLDFNHNDAQLLYEKGELIDYINNNDELEEYNNMDCISLAIIYKRYADALKQMDITKEYGDNLTKHRTIGSIIYKIFTTHCANLKNDGLLSDFPKLDLNLYNEILKYKCAGRVELFNGILEICEKMVSLDICSMYPFVMAIMKDAYYPQGQLIETNEYNEDKIGFYYCDINQRNLKKNNLPNIYPEKVYNTKKDGTQGELIENDWGSNKILKDYLISNVMINQLKKYKCKVNIKKGYYFEDKIKGCDLFEFLLDFMKAKNEQDTNKKTNPELYNSALRETLKLLMNSLSGKVIEGLHTDKTEMTSSYEFHNLVSRMDNKTKKVKSINAINIIGNKVFTSYTLDEEDELKNQRPIYLGVLIYDYSKCYIYDTLYAVVGLEDLVYTDTDAGKFREKKFIEIKEYYENNEVPYWDKVLKYDPRYEGHKLYQENSKVFGSYENEMDELTGNNRFYAFQKKSWVCIDIENYKKALENKDYNSLHKYYKMSFKGVPQNALILDFDNVDFINKDKGKYKIIDDKKAVNYYNTNEERKIKNDLINFCENLYNKKYIYVLTQNFKKVVKNTTRNNTDLTNDKRFNKLNNTIQVQSLIKKISLK